MKVELEGILTDIEWYEPPPGMAVKVKIVTEKEPGALDGSRCRAA